MPPARSRRDGRATLHRSGHRTNAPGLLAPAPARAARPAARPALRSKCRAARAQVNPSSASSHFSRQSLLRYNKVKDDSGFALNWPPWFPSVSVARLSSRLMRLIRCDMTLVTILRLLKCFLMQPRRLLAITYRATRCKNDGYPSGCIFQSLEGNLKRIERDRPGFEGGSNSRAAAFAGISTCAGQRPPYGVDSK